MKKITLSIRALKILSLNLDQSSNYDRAKLRRLDKIQADKIEPLIATYDTKVNSLIKETIQEVAKLNKKDSNFSQLSIAINDEGQEKINQINETDGKSIVELILEDADFDFVVEIFNGVSAWNGTKDTRKLVLEIDDAITNVVPVEDSQKEIAKKNESPKEE